MDSYNAHGVFPTSLPSGSGKYFKGPVRCHYKPRSVYPALCYGIWVYFTFPWLLDMLKVFGTGATSFLAGLAILGISK